MRGLCISWYILMAQFMGADIIPLPSKPALKQIELVAFDAVAVSTSPYTMQQQTQSWPGADQWTGSLSFPQMTQSEAPAFEAWLYSLRGMQNVFLVGHPLRSKPQGNPKGTPVVAGAQLAMATVLATSGWQPNSMQLHPGDHIQIGYRLHVVLNQVLSDANGTATFPIWPSLREPVPDRTPLVLHNAQGMFRLADNKRGVTTPETRLSAVQVLKIVEAR